MFYVWRSNVLKNYGRGWVIVAAASPSAARETARKEFAVFAAEHWHYYDREEIAEKQDEFEQDLIADPVLSGVQFIIGSE